MLEHWRLPGELSRVASCQWHKSEQPFGLQKPYADRYKRAHSRGFIREIQSSTRSNPSATIVSPRLKQVSLAEEHHGRPFSDVSGAAGGFDAGKAHAGGRLAAASAAGFWLLDGGFVLRARNVGNMGTL
jgi:hypothetical protein